MVSPAVRASGLPRRASGNGRGSRLDPRPGNPLSPASVLADGGSGVVPSGVRATNCCRYPAGLRSFFAVGEAGGHRPNLAPARSLRRASVAPRRARHHARRPRVHVGSAGLLGDLRRGRSRHQHRGGRGVQVESVVRGRGTFIGAARLFAACPAPGPRTSCGVAPDGAGPTVRGACRCARGRLDTSRPRRCWNRCPGVRWDGPVRLTRCVGICEGAGQFLVALDRASRRLCGVCCACGRAGRWPRRGMASRSGLGSVFSRSLRRCVRAGVVGVTPSFRPGHRPPILQIDTLRRGRCAPRRRGARVGDGCVAHPRRRCGKPAPRAPDARPERRRVACPPVCRHAGRRRGCTFPVTDPRGRAQ
jgi:hypothetical protein